MFVNHMDDRSVGTVDGDIESKRGLLTKLHHAAYCQHEGYTKDTLCSTDPLCCASKRLFEHMSTCVDEGRCGVPCCKGSRRVWRHYRKCRHVKACPLCSALPSAYTPAGLAPRFLKLSSAVSVGSQASTQMSMSSPHSPPSLLHTTYEESSTAAVVTPPKNNPRRRQNGKENQNNGHDDDDDDDEAIIISSAGSSNSVQIPWDQFQKQRLQGPLPPAPPKTPPINSSGRLQQQAKPRSSNNIPTPPTRRADSPNDSTTSSLGSTPKNKPPLSPRRPQWALF